MAWWTTLATEDLNLLRRRVIDALGERFAAGLGPDIEDVVQQAFIALFRNREAIEPDGDGLFRYLLVVSKNAALDRLKRAKHHAKRREAAGTRIPPPPRPEQELELREETEIVQNFFRELDELDRLIIWSYLVEARSIRSIALELGLNWHRVSASIDRMLERIRRRLAE
jgi:RNA polymerase sigma-70 factor (ECF subfamily)